MRKTVEERFFSKVKKTSTCWIFTGSKNTKGYGQLWVNGRQERAHRLSYMIHISTDLGNFHVLHRCDNRECVNPKHLFLGTNKDNMKDKADKGRNYSPLAEGNKNKTHCKAGHEFTPENTLNLTTRYGEGRVGRGRQCKACDRRRQAEKRAKKR